MRRPTRPACPRVLAIAAVAALIVAGAGCSPEEPTAGSPQRPQPAPRAARAVAAPTVAAGRIRGMVVRGERATPEAGRAVTLLVGDDPPLKTTTDAWGGFVFDAVAPGRSCEVRIEADGCATVRVTGVAVAAGERRDVGELVLDAPRTIEVRIVDERGAPLPGATIDLFRYSSGPLASQIESSLRVAPGAPTATATSDDRGRAKFDVPGRTEYVVVARGAGRARVAQSCTPQDGDASTQVVLRLPPAERLTGRVLDVEGRPVPGAVVVAILVKPMFGWVCGNYVPPTPGEAEWLRSDADADGRFVFDALAPGSISLAAAPRGGSPAFVGSVDVPALHEFDVALAPTGSIVGRAIDAATGAPVSGLVVAAGGRIVVTGVDGNYVIDGVPASRRVWIETVAPDGWAANPRSEGKCDLRANERLRRDVPLHRAAVVTGLATRDGTPVAGAFVEVVTLSKEHDGWFDATAEGRTDAAGTFRIENVLPGEAAVLAVAASGDTSAAVDALRKVVTSGPTARAAAVFRLAPGAVARRDVEVAAGPPAQRPSDDGDHEPRLRVRGRITTADGLPLIDAAVTATAGAETELDFMQAAAPDGTFDVECFGGPAQDGSFTVGAFDSRHELAEVHAKAAADARTMVVDVVLQASPVLRGRVVSDGRPVAGAVVLRGWSAFARTGSDGSFQACLPRRPAGLRVEARGFVPHWFEGFVPPESGEVEWTLAPARTIDGVVVDASGRPLAGLDVRAIRDADDATPAEDAAGANEAPDPASTDAAGRFHVEGVWDGPWRLRVASPPDAVDARIAEFVSDPVAAGTKDVRLQAHDGLRIAGRVVDGGGRGVEDAAVTCIPGRAGDEKDETRTDPTGAFEFAGLDAGARRLDVTPPRGLCDAHREVDAGAADVVVAVAAAATISGVATTPPGEPFERVRVVATRLDARKDGEPEGKWDLDAWINDDGSFRLVVPPNARFRLDVESERAVYHGGDDVKSGATDVRLVGDAGLKIAGVVVDPEGKPVVGADIEASLTFSDVRRARSGDDGRFDLAGMTQRKASLVVTAPDRVPVKRSDVDAGTVDLRIEMRRGLTISGRLLDADGKPARRKQLRALSPRWPNDDYWRAEPDAEGRFEIQGLDEGEWYVQSFVSGCGPPGDVVLHGTFKAGSRDLELRLSK